MVFLNCYGSYERKYKFNRAENSQCQTGFFSEAIAVQPGSKEVNA